MESLWWVRRKNRYRALTAGNCLSTASVLWRYSIRIPRLASLVTKLLYVEYNPSWQYIAFQHNGRNDFRSKRSVQTCPRAHIAGLQKILRSNKADVALWPKWKDFALGSRWSSILSAIKWWRAACGTKNRCAVVRRSRGCAHKVWHRHTGKINWQGCDWSKIIDDMYRKEERTTEAVW